MTTTARHVFDGCTPTWCGHGSQPPRLGWLGKIHTNLSDDPLTFARDDVTTRLAVGTSTPRAMRFWATAFGLIQPITPTHWRRSKARPFEPTERGHWLLDQDTGADPWQEDPGTQWLLHWWLLSSGTCPVPTFRYLLADAPFSRFTREEAIRHVRAAADRTGWKDPGRDQISRDITCLLGMYASPLDGRDPDHPRASIEDALLNPFRDMHIVHRDPATGADAFRVHRSAGSAAPRQLVAYACFNHLDRMPLTENSVALSRLASDPSGPGRCFLAPTPVLRAALEDAAGRHPDLLINFVDNQDGGVRLVWSGAPGRAAGRLLNGYYDR
jgi:hypothetical protein